MNRTRTHVRIHVCQNDKSLISLEILSLDWNKLCISEIKCFSRLGYQPFILRLTSDYKSYEEFLWQMTVLDEKKGGNTAYSNTASNALIKLNMHIILVKLDHLTQRRHEFVSPIHRVVCILFSSQHYRSRSSNYTWIHVICKWKLFDNHLCVQKSTVYADIKPNEAYVTRRIWFYNCNLYVESYTLFASQH